MISLSCKNCRKKFVVKPYRAKTAIACSHKCLWHLTKDKREFYRLKKIIGKKAANNNEIKFKCHHCSNSFFDSPSRKRKYCSKACVNKSSKLTFKPSFTTVRKAMLSRSLINKCNRCGYDEEPLILGVHHQDRNRNNNHLSNLEVLCPNCHSLEHLKHISHGFK